MHSQAVAEYAYFKNMHSHGFSVCRLSKIVEKSSDCRPLHMTPVLDYTIIVPMSLLHSTGITALDDAHTTIQQKRERKRSNG
jgi:hypothetical protein